jgi:predicted nucleic-acid-binding protein
MKQYIIDTNAFLRFFLDDNKKQKERIENLLKQAKQGEIALFVPQIIIFEIQFILDKYYHFDKQDIIEKLTALVSSSYLLVEKKDIFLFALTLYSKKNISFVDCFLASQSKAIEAELFTFDEKLRKVK